MDEEQYKKFVESLNRRATISRQQQLANRGDEELYYYYEGRNLAYLDSLAVLEEILREKE